MKLEQFFFKFKSSRNGLTQNQAEINKKSFGENRLTFKKRDGFIEILLKQFGSFFAVILFVAAVILFALNELIDFYIIITVIVINALIESIQRYKSDSIFETLTKNIPTHSLVIRDGKKKKIESGDIVAGDVVVLSAGDKVPADGIVFYAEDFKVDESILTGESKAVEKKVGESFVVETVTDNENVVFSGSYVVTGEAHMMVVLTGNETQMGLIANKISTIDTELPIHKNIKKLSFFIFIFVLVLSFLIVLIGIFQMQTWTSIFKIAVALFVSAIPESLPVMLTLVLAYGFKRMSDKNVLVRKMQSLDVLGQIDVLALDKTGTITHNQMKVEKIFVPNNQEFYVTGDGYEPEGKLVYQDEVVEAHNFVMLQDLISNAVLTSKGSFGFSTEKDDWLLEIGDPTEVAMLVLGEKLEISKKDLLKEFSLQKDIPFSNQKMYHEVIYKQDKKEIHFFAGAPEVILKKATHISIEDSFKKISDTVYNQVDEKIKEYSTQGYRVIATCKKVGAKIIFTGLLAISDSIRSDVNESVVEVYKRGVDIVIITGDHLKIAYKVAKQIGLQTDESKVLSGHDMAHLNDSQLQNTILSKNIFARVTPQQKLKILDTFKNAEKTIAMTGDGVNDSLALVKADIGISMGKTSSEAAKEASDIILLDNKFGSIVYGIEEGKNIFSNIKKTILFLLSTNFAEIFVVFFAMMLALPLPLSAIAILWLNLVTDTFLVIGFAFERGSTEKRQVKGLITVKEWARILYLGLIMTLIALVVFVTNINASLIYAQSLVLLTIIIMQWFNLLNIRAGNNQSIFRSSFKKNRFFLIGWFISFGLTIFAFTAPFMREILEIQPINISDWLYALGFASFILWFEEIRKLFRRIGILSGKKVFNFR